MALHEALRQHQRCLALSQVSQHFALAFQASRQVFSHTVIVFPTSTYAAFAAIQARPHEIWARFFGSSLEDRLRYTPSDCFDTFPFPEGWECTPSLEAAGKAYYESRAEIMIRNGEGLTRTYNRFHDPSENDPGIARLRELHAAMDRTVLDAYGWHDLAPTSNFILDYDIDEDEWGDKKKPYRYRWNDEVQAEVLARLLELNAERARAEARAGATASSRKGSKSRQTRAKEPSLTKDLFS